MCEFLIMNYKLLLSIIFIIHYILLLFIIINFDFINYLGACVMVGHLRGRQLNPNKIEIYKAEVSRRLLKRKEDSEGT